MNRLTLYFKQAWHLLRENPLLSAISIAGTALAIALVMVMVITRQVRMASYEPENRRDRMLYIKHGRYESPRNISNSGLSLRVIRECFYPLTHAEAVTAVAPYNELLLSVPGGDRELKAEVSYTDAAFWQVFGFRFIAGAPYTVADVESGIRRAVIDENMARALYGGAGGDIVGRTLLVSFVEYTVTAVVKPVSTLAEAAYAQVWLPCSGARYADRPRSENTMGEFRCYLLARSPDDFAAIRDETGRLVEKFNATLEEGKFTLGGQPDTHFVQTLRTDGSTQPDVMGTILRYAVLILILLLVPAINLSGMTLSRMNSRIGEMGIRKAFGATKSNLLVQVLSENLALTLIGGALGLALSYAAIALMSRWLLETDTSRFLDGEAFVSPAMVVRPVVFGCAFLFCLVMNLLSAGIPAWKVSRQNIVKAIRS
jgi:putative ABC transport system permease protein